MAARLAPAFAAICRDVVPASPCSRTQRRAARSRSSRVSDEPAPRVVETFDGSAWVGLVPFEMQVRPPRVAPVPWLSNFPETNVRTYVRAPDGTTGVWFLSLDAARASAVVTARTTYRLPY